MRLRWPKAVGVLVCALGMCLSGWAQERNFWAVLVGISKFQNFPPHQQLEFADADAQSFLKFIKSPRGRSFPEANVKILLNGEATLASTKGALGRWLSRSAKPDDIVYIFIATHGMVEKDAAKAAYLVTHDADPEDLYTTALQMAELGDIIGTRLAKAGRIVLFTDACRAGKLGEQQKGIHRYVEAGASKNTELIGLMASRPNEFSQEGKEFGGGHGVFSYFLLKGMDGAADADKDNTVTVTELIQFLQEQVPKATNNQQHPREFGSFDRDVPLAHVDKPGADLGFKAWAWPRQRELLASVGPMVPPAAPPSELRLDFDRAIKEGRLLAPAGQSAWELYQRLAESPEPQAEKEDARDSLAIALEDEGQKILVAYLRGEATPLTAAEYRYGADLFSRASALTPDFPKLKARERFCHGRALLSEGKYIDAEPALRESIAIDPDGAYSYNALGIAYMHLRRYGEAVQYFQNAVERAPKWAYPHYNLALTYTEMGRLPDAERAYKDALERGPNYAYLHHNLGALYTHPRVNRQGDAEKEFRKAIDLAPQLPYTYWTLGLLYHMQGKLRDAETQLRLSIKVRPDFVVGYVTLAKLLVDRNAKEDAERVLGEALKLDARNPDVRRELGLLLLDRGRLQEAEEQFIHLMQSNPTDALTFVLLGDLYRAQKRFGEAAEFYNSALKLGLDPQRQREVEGKLRGLAKQR